MSSLFRPGGKDNFFPWPARCRSDPGLREKNLRSSLRVNFAKPLSSLYVAKEPVARTCSPRSAALLSGRTQEPRTYKTGPRYPCYDDFSLERATVGARPLQVDHTSSPVGYRA